MNDLNNDDLNQSMHFQTVVLDVMTKEEKIWVQVDLGKNKIQNYEENNKEFGPNSLVLTD